MDFFYLWKIGNLPLLITHLLSDNSRSVIIDYAAPNKHFYPISSSIYSQEIQWNIIKWSTVEFPFLQVADENEKNHYKFDLLGRLQHVNMDNVLTAFLFPFFPINCFSSFSFLTFCQLLLCSACSILHTFRNKLSCLFLIC